MIHPSKIWLITRREILDQLRDRRTLFMIFGLPILLYPLLGIAVAKLSEGFGERKSAVVIVGVEDLPSRSPEGGSDLPPLLLTAGGGFHPSLLSDPSEADRYDLIEVARDSIWSDPARRREALRSGEVEAVVILPPGLGDRLRDLERVEIPIDYDGADEKSRETLGRVDRILERWRALIVQGRREAEGRPEGYIEPVRAEAHSVATRAEVGSSIWAKIFPFLLVMMGLAGAFYPAVDLCAGEKERGTMETLLISPAARGEIVVGKFFTVMLFSIVTALLNLASMGLTALQLASSFSGGGATAAPGMAPFLTPPSLASGFWIVVLLIPLSGFFSAVCLALAVLARSMKEGQYYLTPLYLIALPLSLAPMMPGFDLTPVTAMIPITGVSLLLKVLMLGDYAVAAAYFPIVMVPLIVYGLVAIRIAIDQFKSESVLFRESERIDLIGWVRHLFRDREPTPGPGLASLAFVLMLVGSILTNSLFPTTLTGLILRQLILVLGIPLVLTLLLTRSPSRTLLLRLPRWPYLVAGAVLAFSLNPLASELRVWVERTFPILEMVREQLEAISAQIGSQGLGMAVVALALVPAICEEVAFRGFILSGLRKGRSATWALVISALLFGLMHVLLSLSQQLFNASLMGLVLGLLALRSGSLLPGILFHFVNNAFAVTMPSWIGEAPDTSRTVGILFRDPARGLYHWPWFWVGTVLSALILVALARSRASEAPPESVPDAG